MMESRRHQRRRESVARGSSPMSLAFLGLRMHSLHHGKRAERTERRKPAIETWGQRFRTAFNSSKLIRRILRLEKVLAKKRYAGLLNLAIFIALILQVWSVIKQDGDLDLPNEVLNSMKLEELPYPLNIVVQVHRNNITLPPRSRMVQHPGYVRVQAGSFRNKYPSTELEGAGTFDGIFVITNNKCEQQREDWQKMASSAHFTYSKWPMLDTKHVSTTDPPIPIAPEAIHTLKKGSRASLAMMKRQISYLDAHRRLWQHVVSTGKQRVLIMDDSVFPTERLRKFFPVVMTNIDQESVARQRPWHFIFLRRQKISPSAREATWTMNPVYNHAVVVANSSVGAGAYVLSIAGARFLLEKVKSYRAPLDVEIGLLQRQFQSEFVTLSVCNNDRIKPFCPEIIEEIRARSGRRGFDCAWRRTQERRMASEFNKTLVKS